MRQEEIVNEIRKKCGHVEMPQVGCTLSTTTGIFLHDRKKWGDDRFCIPHLIIANEYDKEQLTDAINNTNKNVKFIKAVKLDCGSVSLDDDHKMTSEESADTIVPHIINALDFASTYLLNKLKRTWKG